jgi:lipopolysaccharide/colanic/teichoic acid biosynthesis glycosyltransferase
MKAQPVAIDDTASLAATSDAPAQVVRLNLPAGSRMVTPSSSSIVAPAGETSAATSLGLTGRAVAKRLLDVAVASLCLVIVSPLLALVWALVRATSPGAALFRQTRVGRDGRTFVLYKFRTMYDGCSDEIHRDYVCRLLEDDSPPVGGSSGLYKLEADPRVTRVGRLLRRASLDELPQLFNVVRGDMSLVGPRPALPWEAERFGAAYWKRFSVPPGLTGLWQVSGRNSLTMRQGLELDIDYVERQTFTLDLIILLKTIPTVLSGMGAR